MTAITAPTIVLLPGNMCDARLWRGLVPLIGDRPLAFPALDADDSIAAMAARVLNEHEGMLLPMRKVAAAKAKPELRTASGPS